jgi:hypothetical protein
VSSAVGGRQGAALTSPGGKLGGALVTNADGKAMRKGIESALAAAPARRA